MHKFTNQFINYCKQKYLNDLKTADNRSYYYKSLPLCIVDCVYSLRARYNSVTVPIVERYANKYMNGDKTSADDDSLIGFIDHLTVPGLKSFADNVARNHQILGRVPKEEVCLNIAEVLQGLTGDDNKSKPDVHIHHCMEESCGEDVSDKECQQIIKETVDILKEEFPNLTVRKLDGVIWRDFSSRK